MSAENTRFYPCKPITAAAPAMQRFVMFMACQSQRPFQIWLQNPDEPFTVIADVFECTSAKRSLVLRPCASNQMYRDVTKTLRDMKLPDDVLYLVYESDGVTPSEGFDPSKPTYYVAEYHTANSGERKDATVYFCDDYQIWSPECLQLVLAEDAKNPIKPHWTLTSE